MSTCISRHGEYGSHTYGEGAERFVCQRCGVLDEDAMLAALATAEAEVEKRWAAIGCRGCHAGACRGHLAPEASAINGHALIAAEAERDALSARLQAVRDAAGSLLAALDEQQWWDYGDHTGTTWEDRAVVEASEDALRAALDASLGTPGDEKPQATKRRAAAGGTRLVALTQAANAIRNHRNEERRPEVAGLNAAAEIIDRMIGGEAFPIGPPSVAPTPIKPVGSSGSAE